MNKLDRELLDSKNTIGKRKQSFVKWLMKKGIDKEEARLICHRKFLRESRGLQKYSNIIRSIEK